MVHRLKLPDELVDAPRRAADAFKLRFRALAVGESMIYHTGFLAYDRADPIVDAVAEAALEYGTPTDIPVRPNAINGSDTRKFKLGDGLAALSARRLGDCNYEYLIKRVR